MNSTAYLTAYLSPFSRWLQQPEVTDILVNRPGEIWIEELGTPMRRISVPDITAATLNRLAQQIASVTHQGVNREHPLLAATLPSGERVQVVLPPATRGDVALAIRKHVVSDLTLSSYEIEGAFAHVRVDGQPEQGPQADPCATLLDQGRISEFLKTAVSRGKTVVISGGTGTGKTTFLNALLKEVPAQERIIVIEDTPELQLQQPNSVGLVAVKGELGEARVTVTDLVEAGLRMRPDRLFLGELRGAEAFAFLRAINTGHPGSMTTVHADSPRGALEQIALMALQAGTNLRRDDIISYAREVIDVVVQLQRFGTKRAVASISYRR